MASLKELLMRSLFYIFLLTVTIGACNNKPPESAVKEKLSKTMKEYLEKEAGKGVVLTIKETTYDDRGSYYDCKFKINIRGAGKDTTGTITAMIAKDFTSVQRKQ